MLKTLLVQRPFYDIKINSIPMPQEFFACDDFKFGSYGKHKTTYGFINPINFNKEAVYADNA